MREDLCRAIYKASQISGSVIIVAYGKHPTEGYEVWFQDTPVGHFPPEYELRHNPPTGEVVQIETEFVIWKSFETEEEIETVTISDADGKHRVKVEQASENVPFCGFQEENMYRVFAPRQAIKDAADIEIMQSYPAFTLINASAETASRIRKNHPVERLASRPQFIAESLQVATGAASEGSIAEEVDMRDSIVKFKAPIKEEWMSRLEEAGAKVLRPLGGFDVVVSADEEAVGRIESFEEVERVAAFVPKLKVSPESLDVIQKNVSEEEIAAAKLKAATEPGRQRQPASIPLPGILIADFFSSKDCEKAKQNLNAQDIRVTGQPTPTRLVVDLSASEDKMQSLRTVYEQTGLQALEEKTLPRMFNDVAREIIGKGVVSGSSGSVGSSLTGRGEIIAVADSGLDTGDSSTVHLDFQDRIKRISSYPIDQSFSSYITNPGGDDGASDKNSGHGTHVAGSVLGNGAQAEALGLPPIRGMAPEAELLFQAIEQSPQWTAEIILYYLQKYGKYPPASGLFGIPSDLKVLFDEAYQNGARIHSNSWGGGNPGEYDNQCRDLDSFVWEHKDFLVLVAAGNSGNNGLPNQGIDQTSVDSPGVAKNCVTVGASENLRPDKSQDTYGGWWSDSFPYNPFNNDPMSDSIDDVVAFSSRGPCSSGRRKPDVIAPGTFILSTRSSQIAGNNFAWGAFAQAKTHYMYMGGTSMSTPLVAGAAALIRQYLRESVGISQPSAALLKAALIHSAEYLNYRYKHPSSNNWADNEQGWGRVNLANIVSPQSPINVLFFDQSDGLITGAEKVYRIDVADNSVPLRVTLVYTDYPGENLINNLNLQLFAPDGDYYMGNDFIKSKQPDAVNNVEGIVVDNPGIGTWMVKVIGSNIVVGPQDFALVLSGGNLRES